MTSYYFFPLNQHSCRCVRRLSVFPLQSEMSQFGLLNSSLFVSQVKQNERLPLNYISECHEESMDCWCGWARRIWNTRRVKRLRRGWNGRGRQTWRPEFSRRRSWQQIPALRLGAGSKQRRGWSFGEPDQDVDTRLHEATGSNRSYVSIWQHSLWYWCACAESCVREARQTLDSEWGVTSNPPPKKKWNHYVEKHVLLPHGMFPGMTVTVIIHFNFIPNKKKQMWRDH